MKDYINNFRFQKFLRRSFLEEGKHMSIHRHNPHRASLYHNTVSNIGTECTSSLQGKEKTINGMICLNLLIAKSLKHFIKL